MLDSDAFVRNAFLGNCTMSKSELKIDDSCVSSNRVGLWVFYLLQQISSMYGITISYELLL
jgi:hypothetical protein